MQHIKEFLDTNLIKYNNFGFIENDPISIPHKFTKKEDIEIAGLLTALIAWGNRKAILKSANQLMQWFDNSPHDFILNHNHNDLKPFNKFIYRTYNGTDCVFCIKSLQNIYKNYNGLEQVFINGYKSDENMASALAYFRTVFLSIPHEPRTQKHLANPEKGSAAKRLNMYLRWLVRHDNAGVDFGLWKNISPKHLMIPLDVHSGNIARKLGLLNRHQNDWNAVTELTNNLKQFDANDPIKYDFALFGLGVNNDF